jgi:hypothetical protein
MHPCSFPPRLDNPGIPHQRKMPGDLRLRLLQRVRELTHTDLAFGLNEHERPEASRVRKNVEQ